jgi:ATP-binding cassette, subfamily B, bacterial PglK
MPQHNSSSGQTASRANRLSYLLGRLWQHIGRHRRRQFYGLGVLMALSAVAEVVSLGAVIPFLGVLAAPDAAFNHWIVIEAGQLLDANREDLILFFTLAFIAAALIAGALRIGLLWATTRVSFSTGSDLSIELYRRTLYQPYAVHISRNSSSILSGIGKVGGVMSILSQCLMLASSAVLLMAITAALLVMDPLIALGSVAMFGISYGVIAVITRHKLRVNGVRIAEEQTQVFKALQEGLGGIRDILLDSTQKIYCDVYQQADRPLRRGQGNNIFIAGSPRFAMEALGLVMIALLAYFLNKRMDGISSALPMLGALALGAQRLLPVLQQGYSAWAIIIGSQASLADTIELLEQPIQEKMLTAPPAPLNFDNAISFVGVNFRYTEDGPWVVRDLNLTIRKGSRVGLVGTTGSGKSTTLDILMGLLSPTAGQMLVDGTPVEGDRLRAWQRTIAHVPQSIYLSDASFAENIAFGVSLEQIDHARVKAAAQQAQISDFIETCPQGYRTSVGERGIRLSGGQRQRVGIARALYKQAAVMVFDEATSALDNVTEASLMEAIEALNRNLTVLLIAHRLTTVRQCDVIVEMKNGSIHAIGDYESLMRSSESFRQLAGETDR